MLVANLRDPAPPRGSAVSKTLARTQAGPPGPVLSEQARLRSEKPPEPGTPPSPLSQRLHSPELCFLYSHRSDPPNLGVGAAPLVGPGEEGAVAWVLPASNRFMRDLLPFSQAAAKAGRPWKPAAAANGDANRYPHFPPLFLSSKTKPPRDPSGRNLKVLLSLSLPRRHRAGGGSGTSPLPPRTEMAAVCLGC